MRESYVYYGSNNDFIQHYVFILHPYFDGLQI